MVYSLDFCNEGMANLPLVRLAYEMSALTVFLSADRTCSTADNDSHAGEHLWRKYKFLDCMQPFNMVLQMCKPWMCTNRITSGTLCVDQMAPSFVGLFGFKQNPHCNLRPQKLRNALEA